MIVKVPKPGITDYELKYFMEADTPARKNMRKITLADSGKATVNGVEHDDDDIGRDDDDLPEDDDTDDTPDTDDDTDVDDVDLDDDDLDVDDEGDDEDTGGDDDIATDDEETGDDTDAEDSAGGTEGDGGDEGGNDDVAIDDEGDGTDDDEGNNDDGGDGSGDGDNKAKTPEEKRELVQKFNLFTKMRNLHETTGKYIEKINMLIAYNTDNTTAYQAVCDKLDEMRGYIYEYMLVKFDGTKYVENMLFYHRATTLVYLILEELDAIQVKGDEKKATTSKKSSKRKTTERKSK